MSAWERFADATPGSRHGGPAGLRDWPRSLVRWLLGQSEEDREPQDTVRTVARFQNICISRETGAGGGTIARLVGQRLGWKVYNHELLEAIAHRMGLAVDEVRCFDELAPSVVQDWLLPLREEHYAPLESYLDHLAKLVEAIGRAGESVLVGRGAGFLLPRETTLSLRIIAPLRIRAMRLAERTGVSVRTARRAARDLDRRRAQFDRTMHRKVSADPHNYDLVLDSHSLGIDIAVEIIVKAVEAGRAGRGGRHRHWPLDPLTERPERRVRARNPGRGRGAAAPPSARRPLRRTDSLPHEADRPDRSGRVICVTAKPALHTGSSPERAGSRCPILGQSDDRHAQAVGQRDNLVLVDHNRLAGSRLPGLGHLPHAGSRWWSIRSWARRTSCLAGALQP